MYSPIPRFRAEAQVDTAGRRDDQGTHLPFGSTAAATVPTSPPAFLAAAGTIHRFVIPRWSGGG